MDLILEFLRKNTDADVEVTLAGYGELEGMVTAMVQRDSRLNFLGTLTDEALTAEIARYDLLLCLRDPESPVCQYAFPSKLIKFMSSGIPVISNEFPGLGNEYHPHLLMIKEFSVTALRDIIQELNTVDFRCVGDSARTYIEANHRWADISLEILEFMFPLSLNDQLHK